MADFHDGLTGHSPDDDDDASRPTGSGQSDSGSVTHHKVRPKPYNGAARSLSTAGTAATSNLPSHLLEKRKALQVRAHKYPYGIVIIG